MHARRGDCKATCENNGMGVELESFFAKLSISFSVQPGSNSILYASPSWETLVSRKSGCNCSVIVISLVVFKLDYNEQVLPMVRDFIFVRPEPPPGF
jgi:hypothetical protein